MTASATHAPLHRPDWPAEPGKRVTLYLGSGRAGACFGADGLMDAADADGVMRTGRTVLTHAEHWSRGRWGIDQQAPLARIHWAEAPDGAGRAYSQTYDTARGRVETRFADAGGTVAVEAGFSPASRDLLALAFTLGGSGRRVVIAPERSHQTFYEDEFTGPPAAWSDLGGGMWSARVRLGTADSVLVARVYGAARVKRRAGRLEVFCGRGRSGLVIGMASWARSEQLRAEVAAVAGPAAWLEDAARAWSGRFGDAGVRLPDANLQGWFDRGHHHLLASYEPAARCPAPPMGWSGNGWGYHFPQDLSYIHPVFLRLGHLDLARGAVEFYASRIEQMQEATRRLYGGAAGALWAWEFPIGADTVILPDGRAPNHFQFELHNAAYPARMAAETAAQVSDLEWSRAFAWPVVRESARFYASVLQRGRDGLWGMCVTPSMGQDEFGGEDAPDYLCALFAAEYTLRTALRLARACGVRLETDEANRWRTVLSEGLAYPRLLRPELGGIYATSGREGYRLGRQKHPVQINPLVFLPLGRIDEPTRRAYRLRHSLCENERTGMHHPGTRGSFYNGWTLGAYWLAAVRMGDGAGLEHELKQTLVSQYADPEWVQAYESSGFWKPYYTTTTGLFMQAVCDVFAGDWNGKGPGPSVMPPSWRGAEAWNLRRSGRTKLRG